VRTLTVGVVAGLVAATIGLAAPQAGTAAASSASSAASPVSSLRWGSCPGRIYPDLVDGDEQCAALVVPLDYRHPHNGRTVTLELSILRHTSSARHYKGVILANPGGPGDGGLDLPDQLGPFVPHNVGADYDWIGWDPRGVGASKPAIRCEPGYFSGPRRSYVPRSASLVHYWLKRSRAYAQACERKYPALLDHMTTKDSARDMESIRRALGVNQISFYGYSYGTYLGEVYSTLYPRHVRLMVLDSNVDPRRVWYRTNLDQDRAFERNIRIYFRWVAKYHDVYHLGTTGAAVYRRYNADLARLTHHPAGVLGPDEWQDALEGAAYYRLDYKELAYAWNRFDRHGNPHPMIGEYRTTDTPRDDNGFAVYNAVQCTDAHWPRSWRRWRRDNNAYYKKYPFLTWNNAWYNAPCLYWGGRAHRPLRINGARTRSVLLIDETLDAATPFEGSLEVRRLYPHSSLIAEPGGTTHADSLFGDRCVDDQIATYLKTGKRPSRKHWDGPDALCRPLPVPRASARNPELRRPAVRRPSLRPPVR
jgi:pimeloyl-ACP methyl ester carboxylesterase